ncbi:MAG TPA: response regulator [Candidatus Binatia bacterium]|nr:response regulator [Candidatus Binatia bacterium]
MPSRRKILVVEDDNDVREAMIHVLAAEGYEAIPAGDGEEALSAIDGGLEPCVILLDLMMPRMDGWEFIEHHRRRESRTPIIVVSAYGSPDQARGGGSVIAYMRKPIDIDALLAVVARCCAQP